MKLVESDVPDRPTDEVTLPPPPPHRRVAVSLAFTLTVLVATVAIIYFVFPERHDEVLSIAIEHHQDPEAFEIDRPSELEVRAWSIGVMQRPVPWPDLSRASVVRGAYGMRIFRQPVALVRLEVEGDPVTLMAMRARDAPPRRRRVEDGELVAQSWRRGKWTLVAVGLRASAERWRAVVDAR